MLTPILTRLKTAVPLAQGRAYPAPAPKGTARPYLTVTPVGVTPGMALAGLDGSVALSVQIDAWASTAASAETLAWQALDALSDPALCIGSFRQLPAHYEPDPGLHRIAWEVQAVHSLPAP